MNQDRIDEAPPKWFQAPAWPEIVRPRAAMWSGESKQIVARVLESASAGQFAMPPWQRDSVWSESQRIKLFDSLVRGLSIGPITLWCPPRQMFSREVPFFDGFQLEYLSFLNCPIDAYPRLVIDGQQRLTTLLMGAAGDLDHWRWDGRTWTTGSGFMTPKIALTEVGQDLPWCTWLRNSSGAAGARRCMRDAKAVSGHEITFMMLDGSIEDMIDTYERLATCGTPHSTEDLAIMKQWFDAWILTKKDRSTTE